MKQRLTYGIICATALHGIAFITLPSLFTATPTLNLTQGKNSTEIQLVAKPPTPKRPTESAVTPQPLPNNAHHKIRSRPTTQDLVNTAKSIAPPSAATTHTEIPKPTIKKRALPSIASTGVQSKQITPTEVFNPAPTYPLLAKRKGWQGQVILNIEVLPSGKVGRIDILKKASHAIFDKSARTHVKQWRFNPDPAARTRAVWVKRTIRFELTNIQ